MRTPIVFVVDDEEQICTLLTRTLSKDGARVLAYTSANAALAAVESMRPDVVVTDMMMPELSGLELATRAKELDPSLSVILMTGYASLENVIEAMRTGVDDFVTKPFTASEIREVLARVLARRSARANGRAAETVAREDVPPAATQNAGLVRRMRDIALLESIHGLLTDEIDSAEILAHSRNTLLSALGVTRSLLVVPADVPGSFRVAAQSDGDEPSDEAISELGFLSLVTASGSGAMCGPAELGPLCAHLDTGPMAAAPVGARDSDGEDRGVLVVSRAAFGRPFDGDDLRVVGVVATALGDVWRRVRATERAVDAYYDTLCDVVEASEQRTPWFRNHSARVADIAAGLAQQVGLSAHDRLTVSMSSRLLDIGRIEIPDEVLVRPGRLSNEEWRFLRSHCDAGEQIVRPLGRLKQTKPVLLHHHENWDGTGYPGGLRGDEIPSLAAIARIADTYTALTSPRPWRAAMEPDHAVRFIVDQSGSHFHPQFVAAFTERHFETSRDQDERSP